MKQISMNFGAIKDTIYRYSGKVLVNESKGQISVLNAFMNEIKSNPLLKLQYLIYKNLEEGFCKKENLAERFINQNLKLLEGHSWEDIVELNKKVRYSLLEQSHVEGQKGKEDFYEAINTLIKSTTQKGYTDISKSQEAYDFIVQHLLKPKTENLNKAELQEDEYPKFLSWKFVTELAVNNFNERYAHLNENEKSLLKVLLSQEENKKNYFVDLKNENLESIKNLKLDDSNEKIDSTLQRFADKINSLDENVISGADLDEAIIHLFELRETITEMSV